MYIYIYIYIYTFVRLYIIYIDVRIQTILINDINEMNTHTEHTTMS